MPEKRIGDLLIASGHITEEQFAKALEAQQQTPHEPIGRIICKLGFMSTEEMSLALDFNKKRLKLGDILLKQQLIDQDKLTKALELCKKEQIPLGKAMMNLHFITEERLAKAIATQYDLPFIAIGKHVLHQELGKYFSASFAMKHRIVPIEKHPGSITVAMAFPLSFYMMRQLETQINLTITPVIAKESDIAFALEDIYGVQSKAPSQTQTDPVQLDIVEDYSSDDLRSKYVLDYNIDYLAKRLISIGVNLKASDIHLENTERGAQVRFRIDGVLQTIDMGGDTHLILSRGRPLASKIKILSELDITERRRPQNGSFRVKMSVDKVSKTVDFRVSTLPTKYGENIVIRILDSKGPMTLQGLGYSKTVVEELNWMLAKPTGIFLATGPTGSGKSSTLYAILGKLNKPGVKTMTVEDPIEYSMDGISQSEVNTVIGNTFAEYLRAFLRQDPDNIMVGEIRDTETALIAIRASLTGHTVLSTLHTNDATGVVPRLLDMGVDATMLSSSLRCVLSQRLVRITCKFCYEHYQPSTEILAEFGISPDAGHSFVKGGGCHQCHNTGFSGRQPVVEIWAPSHEEVLLINKHSSNLMLRESAFFARNRQTMLEDGVLKVMQGLTTLDELARVIPYEQFIEYRRKAGMGLAASFLPEYS